MNKTIIFIYTLVFLVFVPFVDILFFNTIINEKLFIYNWHYIITVILIIPLIIIIINKDIKKIKDTIAKIKFILKILFLFISASYIFVTIIFENSIPLILHVLSSNNSSKIVFVDHKFLGSKRHNCVSLRYYNNFCNGEICNINKKLYKKLTFNSELLLDGSKSYFAFTINNVTLK